MLQKSIFILALFSAAMAACARPESIEEGTLVSVTGEGEVHATPDIAIVGASLVQQGNNSRALLERVNREMASVIDALEKQGIPESDIQAGQVRINQVWQRQDGRSQPAGYNAQRPVTVTVKKIDQYPRIIDAMSEAGVNTINNISFDYSKRQELADRALKLAVKDAARKAGLLAGELDIGHCKPRQLSVGGGHIPVPRMEIATMKADVSGYNPGQQLISASVSGEFFCK